MLPKLLNKLLEEPLGRKLLPNELPGATPGFTTGTLTELTGLTELVRAAAELLNTAPNALFKFPNALLKPAFPEFPGPVPNPPIAPKGFPKPLTVSACCLVNATRQVKTRICPHFTQENFDLIRVIIQEKKTKSLPPLSLSICCVGSSSYFKDFLSLFEV